MICRRKCLLRVARPRTRIIIRRDGRNSRRETRPDPIIATAILDRPLHHSTTVNIRGESYPLKDRRKAGLIPPREQERAGAATSLASASFPPKTRPKTALGSTAAEANEAHT